MKKLILITGLLMLTSFTSINSHLSYTQYKQRLNDINHYANEHTKIHKSLITPYRLYIDFLADNDLDLARMRELEFITFDYIEDDSNAEVHGITGFIQSDYGTETSYCVINNSKFLSRQEVMTVVFHELTHFYLRDPNHNKDEKSIMYYLTTEANTKWTNENWPVAKDSLAAYIKRKQSKL